MNRGRQGDGQGGEEKRGEDRHYLVVTRVNDTVSSVSVEEDTFVASSSF